MINEDGASDSTKNKEVKRLFNYRLKENCIKYIKSYFMI